MLNDAQPFLRTMTVSEADRLRPALVARACSRMGPFKSVHVFWLAGMSCDGCSIAVLGATAPSVGSLLTGKLPGVPIVYLHHTAVQVEAGDAYMEPMRRAWSDDLGEPYVVVCEGSIADESRAQPTGGYWSAVGEELLGDSGEARQVPLIAAAVAANT